ncbi:hypothetical protein EHE19_005000 [Ruminiclostridium herbifermentans]|uniref:Uncharacterized protein n=2 Tax=Ruminiclostridium herbifermentans TaxID=2488810 RepID=A0A4U7JD02_9FIRM|nr:hypothetical protein EHE19_005000 [Ruminiclostridium herbifermentans]
MTVSIREIKKQNFYDKESIIKYLTKISPNFEKIMIYNNVNDDSAITSLYIITGEKLSNYIVCYEDACYLLESDYRNLDSYLFKNDHEVNYEVKILEIECANSYKAHIKETITYNKDELENVEYEIIQDKEETKYIGELSIDKKYQYQFILKNDKGEKLLTLSTYGEFYDVIKFLDVNMDGYADIRFLEEPGTLNNEYILYVYDDSAKNFIKVKCDEMLSEFDVHDDYLLNYQKDNADSGVIQKLTWENKYTLVKVLEEQYNVD